MMYQLWRSGEHSGWDAVMSEDGVPVDLVAMSRTHGVFESTPRNEEIAAMEAAAPPPNNDEDTVLKAPALLPNRQDPEKSSEAFDGRRFEPKPWCVYNVMRIGRMGDGRVMRLGIGVCHMDAFLQAEPQWERLVLE